MRPARRGRWDAHRARAAVDVRLQEAVDEEYKSEAEEEDQFDSDFNDSEVGRRFVRRVQLLVAILTRARPRGTGRRR